MIWDIIEQSTFDKHFQNPALTIQQLLVDENILTEMQNLNPQLLEFVNRNLDDIMDKLVKYVTVMPKEEEGYDRCHRLPYISSEMLAIDSQIFYDAFFSQKEGKQTQYLSKLYAFLNSNAVANELLLGYFEKVTNNLYKGRKIDFTKSVAANLPLFVRNLDKQTIGNLLKNCVILLGQKQGVLFDQRKKITSTLISNLVQPTIAHKQSQIRQVCSDALVQIIGRHKTFSSGEELLNYVLCFCGELLLVYSQTDVPQICKFLIGLLTKGTQKIYDPELDTKVSIFRLPPQHQKLLQGYLPLHLHYCKKQAKAAPQIESFVRQQNGKTVVKINPGTLNYLTLVAITLQNQIDQFLVCSENDLVFAWECMREHPRNDIAIVQVGKILSYAISDRSMNKDKLHENLLEKFKIVDRFCQIFQNKDQEKLLRPHLFHLWNKLREWAPQQLKDSNQKWKKLCIQYSSLIPLHTKTTGLNYNRPTNTKLIIDQQEAKAVSQKGDNQQPKPQHIELKKEVQFEQEPKEAQQQQEEIQQSLKQEHHEDFHIETNTTKEPRPFNEFDFFYNSQQQKKEQTQQDFSQFGTFQ